ncbi:MAG: hypothetical protein EPN82_11955 [Bacteroidetes bacterium]|nr:MAG: hypothetical protein EPN82_11955 [Bacteroidota bacterium]
MKSHTKRLILINLLIIFVFSSLNSQVIYFSGKDKQTSESVKLDSIKIINNTLQRDTTIIGDSIDLSVLTAVMETENVINSDFLVENISESGSDALSFRVKANKDVNLCINLYNIVGRTILSHDRNFPEGNQNFKINEFLIPGIYFASFCDGRTTQTIKVLKTDGLFGNYGLGNDKPQETKIVLSNDSYTFIGYAKGFRRDTINAIAEDGKMYEFQLVKLGDWEFNDWSIYLSSMSFPSTIKEYWSTGNPPNMGVDSNIYIGSNESREINYKNSDIISDECNDDDTIRLKYNCNFCFNIQESGDIYIKIIFYFNIDTNSNIISELKLNYYLNHHCSNYFSEDLDESYNFTFINIAYNYLNDGTILAEVIASDYKSVLKEFENDYEYWSATGMSGNHWFKRYIEWNKLSSVKNDIFFRLVLRK